MTARRWCWFFSIVVDFFVLSIFRFFPGHDGDTSPAVKSCSHYHRPAVTETVANCCVSGDGDGVAVDYPESRAASDVTSSEERGQFEGVAQDAHAPLQRRTSATAVQAGTTVRRLPSRIRACRQQIAEL